MAVTIGNFSPVDDGEIDAESPITETLMKRNRDNSYWIDTGTRRTVETSQTKVLVPDGSGGVEWVEGDTVAGIAGTKGAGLLGATSGTPTQIAELSSKILRLTMFNQSTHMLPLDLTIDQSDGTYSVISSRESGGSITTYNATGTLTGSFVAIINYGTGTNSLFARISGGNVELYAADSGHYNYIWL